MVSPANRHRVLHNSTGPMKREEKNDPEGNNTTSGKRETLIAGGTRNEGRSPVTMHRQIDSSERPMRPVPARP